MKIYMNDEYPLKKEEKDVTFLYDLNIGCIFRLWGAPKKDINIVVENEVAYHSLANGTTHYNESQHQRVEIVSNIVIVLTKEED